MRIERTENETDPHHRQRAEEDKNEANRATRIVAFEDDVGIPVARYAEWDYVLGRKRLEWTTVLEYEPRPAPASAIDRIYHDYADVLSRITKLVRTARVSKPIRLRTARRRTSRYRSLHPRYHRSAGWHHARPARLQIVDAAQP